MILAVIYRIFGFNYIKGRKNLKISWEGVFAKRVSIKNYGRDNLVKIEKVSLKKMQYSSIRK